MSIFSFKHSALKYGPLALALFLSLLMWATRGQHAATLTHLPDASWAVFFLLGFYFRQRMLLPLFLAQAALADYIAITQFGTSDYCVTPAYAFLLPAYSALWLGGRQFAGHARLQVRTLPLYALTAFAGALVCELISSGSFYFLGGRYADTSLQEFGARLVQYFPGDLAAVALYAGCAAALHLVFTAGRHSSTAAQ